MRRLAAPLLFLLLGSVVLPVGARAAISQPDAAVTGAAALADPRNAIETAIGTAETVAVGGVVLKAGQVRDLYAGRGWFPLWIDMDGRLDRRVDPILARLAKADRAALAQEGTRLLHFAAADATSHEVRFLPVG